MREVPLPPYIHAYSNQDGRYSDSIYLSPKEIARRKKAYERGSRPFYIGVTRFFLPMRMQKKMQDLQRRDQLNEHVFQHQSMKMARSMYMLLLTLPFMLLFAPSMGVRLSISTAGEDLGADLVAMVFFIVVWIMVIMLDKFLEKRWLYKTCMLPYLANHKVQMRVTSIRRYRYTGPKIIGEIISPNSNLEGKKLVVGRVPASVKYDMAVPKKGDVITVYYDPQEGKKAMPDQQLLKECYALNRDVL